MAPKAPARSAGEGVIFRPMLGFFAAQLGLPFIGVAVPPFAFAFVAIAWSGRAGGLVGRVLTAATCGFWVYARAPMASELVLTPLEWVGFATLELSGLLGLAWIDRRRSVAPVTSIDDEQRYRTLVHASASVIWRVDADGKLIELTGWEALTGRPPPGPTGEVWQEYVHADDRPAAGEAWRRAQRLREPASVECRIRISAGRYRHYLLQVVPIKDARQRVREWIGTAVDIDNQKETEGAVLRKKDAEREKEQEEGLVRYRFLADAMPQIVWTALPDGRIDYINWRWSQLADRPLEFGVAANDWFDAVHPEDRPQAIVAWRAALERGTPYEIQHRIRRASDGAYLWHLTRAVPRRDERGEVVQWVGSSTDIDQQCRAYAELAATREELRQHAAGLEARIRERTECLEEANAELRLLTSSVSHDLRTPLHIVQNFVDEIVADRSNQLSPESTELLDRISYTTKRMARLMHDLLSYTGISHASQHIRQIELADIVSEVLDQHREVLRNSQATVTVEEPLLAVLADYTSTFQVLSNLISNALKFSVPSRPLQLCIRTEATPPHVRLWVEDNGMGIDGRDQERIFRLFERLDGAKGQPGSGVGLALVRKAVSRMGGAAGVISQPGHGSSFWVDFDSPPPQPAK